MTLERPVTVPSQPRRDPVGRSVMRHGIPAAAIVLWLVSLPRIDLTAMTDLGLLSVLPLSFYAALGLLTVGFFVSVARGRGPIEVGLHLALLVLMLHGTTAILYGTVRYSWAWKHIGIVDFIQRNGFIEPEIEFLDVYHNWPSFFGLMAFFTELAGFESAASFAAWAPLVFNGLILCAVIAIFKVLTADWRIVWAAAWLFSITNWVGQDYFSPQAFAFFLYLVVIGILLRWFTRRPPRFIWSLTEWFRSRVLQAHYVRRLVISEGRVAATEQIPPEPALVDAGATVGRTAPITHALWERSTMLGLLCIVLGVGAAIITSHPLTPLMLVAAMIGLAVVGVANVKKVPLALGALTAAWMVTGAGAYVGSRFADAAEVTGDVTSNFGETFIDLSKSSASQSLVALMGRGLVGAVAVITVVGTVRWLRRREFDLRPVVLTIVPLALVVGGDYGGEALFRIYLFALPFAAFLGAHAFFPGREEARGRAPILVVAVAGMVLMAGFLFAYFGKERQYYFTADEVAAAEYVFQNGVDNTLLIEGSANYPSQFVNYERFVYVPISREPVETHARILADPVGVMEYWMSNDVDYADSYLIITRSQKAEVDATGVMPPGSLDEIENALLASPLFEVVIHNDNATVFRLAEVDR